MGKHLYSTSVTVDVDVDIDTDDLSDEDLIDICEKRGIFTGSAGGDQDDVTEMFYAFKLGRNERAIELAKKIAQDHTGRIL